MEGSEDAYVGYMTIRVNSFELNYILFHFCGLFVNHYTSLGVKDIELLPVGKKRFVILIGYLSLVVQPG